MVFSEIIAIDSDMAAAAKILEELSPQFISAALPLRSRSAASARIRNATRFQLVSSARLKEGSRLPSILAKAENCCVLGDMASARSNVFQDLIHQLSIKFENVYFIAGNCEYGKEQPSSVDWQMMKLCDHYQNVRYLQKSAHLLLPDLIIAGSTMDTRRYHQHLGHAADLMLDCEKDRKRLLYLTYQSPYPSHTSLLHTHEQERVLISNENGARDGAVVEI